MEKSHKNKSFDVVELQNQLAYDRMARSGHVLATIVTEDELRNPLRTVDTSGWLGNSIFGWNVLCLAAAGGRHSALYRAAGANVTVVDISEGMLELDRFVAKELNLDVRLYQGSMTDLSMLQTADFDLIVQPVSTCYVENLTLVFEEIARVLKPGGLYLSQHKQPTSVQSTLWPLNGKYAFDTEIGKAAKKLPANEKSPLREPNTVEFAHSLDSILGGICRSGLVIEDVTEPYHGKQDAEPGSIGHRSRFIAPYIRVKARRTQTVTSPKTNIILA
jgi:SAM-dependent methyltransferase